MKKAHHLGPVMVEGRILRQAEAIPGSRQIYLEHGAQGGGGTVAHHQDAIREQHRLVHIMSDHDDGVAQTALDLHQGILHLGTGEGVERPERLVHQEHLGLHGQGAGDADALLHAAGDLVGATLQGMLHVHQFEIAQGPVVAFGAGFATAEHLIDGETHIVVDAEPGQQGMVLEHHRPIRTGLGHLASFQHHPTLGGAQQTGDDIQHRRFTAARVADQGDELALGDIDVDLTQHLQRPLVGGEAEADVIDLQISRHVLHYLSAQHRAFVPGEMALQEQHAAIEQETDEADGQHRHHDAGQ